MIYSQKNIASGEQLNLLCSTKTELNLKCPLGANLASETNGNNWRISHCLLRFPTFAEVLWIYSCATDTHKIHSIHAFTIMLFYKSDSRDACSVDLTIVACYGHNTIYCIHIGASKNKRKNLATRKSGEKGRKKLMYYVLYSYSHETRWWPRER